MKISTFVTGAFQENCYLVVDESSAVAAIIDPGAEGERLCDVVRQSGAQLQAVWLTHAHVDHIGGVARIVEAFHVPVYLHPLELPLYTRGRDVAAMYGLPFDEPPLPDHEFAADDVLTLGALRFRVMNAPGHAPGHVVIHGEGVAFVGDCLFAGSVGRTDLPLSNGRDLEHSLARIVSLAEETVVYPGHGPSTTVGEELRSNPFLTGVARPVKR